MKKRLFLIPFTLFAGIHVFLNGESQFAQALATSNVQTIGVYYEVERVQERTRVVVTGEEIDIAIEAGRDLVLVSGPIFPPGGPVRPLSYGDTYVSGYYYATPQDGRIIARHELDNTTASLVNVLRILEDEVCNFVEMNNLNYTNKQKNNLLLEYLRSVNNDYVGDDNIDIFVNKWGFLAGHDSNLNNFIDFLNSLSTGGIEIREYFPLSCFIEDYYSQFPPVSYVRYLSFLINFKNFENVTNTDLETRFKTVVFDLLGFNYNGGNPIGFDIYSINPKYRLLYDARASAYEPIRKEIASQFCDYILSQGGY